VLEPVAEFVSDIDGMLSKEFANEFMFGGF